MRLWLTAQEIADLALPGFPATKRGIQKLAEREGWPASGMSRTRQGREGGGGLEYHIDLFPMAQKLSYAASFVRFEREDLRTETDLALSPKEREARDARLIVVKVADRFRDTTGMQAGASDDLFARLYQGGDVAVPDWVKAAAGKLSRRTLARWRQLARAQKNRLAHDPGKARKGTGILDRAENGELRSYCLAAYASNQFLSAKHIRNAALAKFGKTVLVETSEGQKRVDMPPLRTFQNALKGWKSDLGGALLKITDPDAYKSKARFVATGANRVDRLNQVWEIDASPSDVMTTDGRRNIYLAIDLYSRRVVILVTDTARAAGVSLLIRKALTQWGVPEVIKTDNGSDFAAKSTVRLLEALNIEQEFSTPYSPEQKGTVERAIGTFQRDCCATLPGFIGHSVADRKVIENRKAFSARLGTDDAKLFHVEVSAAELQAEADRWAREQYAHTAHEGLKRKTPFQVANAWRGEVRWIEDEHALDVLPAPVAGGEGLRRVTKQGIRVDHSFYLPDCALPGQDVFCRHDPSDLGRLWVFAEDGETYLGQAVCPDLAGLDPAEVIAKVRAGQKAVEEAFRGDIAKAKRQINSRTIAEAQREAHRDNADILAFPKAGTSHTTGALAASRHVGQSQTAAPLSPAEQAAMAQLEADGQDGKAGKGAPIAASPRDGLPDIGPKVLPLGSKDTPEQRFDWAVRMEARIADGQALSDQDAVRLSRYQASAEYRGFRMMRGETPFQEISAPR
ncbi:MAG: DDE-type integrase/transposase/recombinase [Roseibium sp.]|uniref:DDE-type integrase/transposase/recombinase n=1 Tax=Roseibium sp. TaxID=1936156 RepID=UPI003298A9F6